MDKLSEIQKLELIHHMNRNDGDTFLMHSQWATWQFHTLVTEKECRDLFFSSIF